MMAKLWSVMNILLNVPFLIPLTVKAELDKPGILTNHGFNIFEPGLIKNYPKVQYQVEKWAPGWIPQDCDHAVTGANLSAADVSVYNGHYDDCPSPWIICHHKASSDATGHFFDNIGRIPVRARSHVRTFISLPGSGDDHGYYVGGLISIANAGTGAGKDPSEWSYLFMILHEVGHALDHTAYSVPLLSATQDWLDAYNADSRVPDNYARTALKEDFAQSTVVAAYDLIVPGGLATLPGNHDWSTIRHQYEFIKKKQADAGGLLLSGGTCTKRIQNAKVVKLPTKGKVRRATILRGKPNVELAPGLKVIEMPRESYSTEGDCLSHEV